MTSVVQFLHPGGEHRFDRWFEGHRWKDWNERLAHRRKYLLAQGEWTRDPKQKPTKGLFTFWGEWEPQSRVTKLPPNHPPHYPRWLHEPRLDLDVVNIQPERCWQNTDPLVFGDRFRYAICRQVTRRGNRARASLLENGDIILFGSRKGGQFALDSVFVVGQYSDFYSLDDLPTWESDLHRRIAAERAPPPPCGFRLYSGRTWSPSDPFSYVPCLPVTDEPIAHPRPSIKPVGVLEGIISPGMTQNFNETPVDAVRARAIWEAVTDQVLRQGCALGVAIDEPGWVNT